MQSYLSLFDAVSWLKENGFPDEFQHQSNGLWHCKSKLFFLTSEILMLHKMRLESETIIDDPRFIIAVEIKNRPIRGYFFINKVEFD